MAKDKKNKKRKAVKAVEADSANNGARGSGTDVRKAAEQLVELAKSPAVRELAIAALGAAAAKIAESTKAREEARAQRGQDGEEAGDKVADRALRLGDAIRAAALEGARQLLDEIEHSRGPKSAARKREEESAASEPTEGEAR